MNTDRRRVWRPWTFTKHNPVTKRLLKNIIGNIIEYDNETVDMEKTSWMIYIIEGITI